MSRESSAILDVLRRVQTGRLAARRDLDRHGPTPEVLARLSRLEEDATVILARWEEGDDDEATTVRKLASLLPS
jgi:hypothetical protein